MTLSAVLVATFFSNVSLDFRSTRLTSALRWPSPIMVSASRVADSSFRSDDRGPRVNACAVDDGDAASVAGVAFTPELAATQVLGECAARLFVSIDILVNGFVADTWLLFIAQAAGDLLGAPLLVEQGHNALPGVAANLGAGFRQTAFES